MNTPVLERKEKIANLYAYHIPTFEKLKVENPFFIPKVCYRDKNLGVKVISFFPSEVKRGTDIYVEFSTKDCDIEDPERILYKWKYNPYYSEEYQLSEPHNATADRRYLVPISELIAYKRVSNNETPIGKESNPFSDLKPNLSTKVSDELEFELPNADLDLPFDQLTIRDLAAILLRKPVSMKLWLNEIINNK